MATRFDPFDGVNQAEPMAADALVECLMALEKEAFGEWLAGGCTGEADDLYESAWVAYRIATHAWLREVLDFGQPAEPQPEAVYEYETVDGVYALA